MANQWVRLWVDMANDPKWRTISRASGQSISSVMAVYIHLLTSAANATERGRTQVNDEDIASALDMGTEAVSAIREAMQGRVLDGELLTGWDKRQPAREDNSAERSKAWREQRKAEQQSERNRTQPNATERQIREEEIREEEIKKGEKKAHASRGQPLDLSILPPELSQPLWQDFVKHRKGKRAPVNTQAVVDSVAAELRKAIADGWTADDAIREAIAAGWTGIKADWLKNRKGGATGSSGLKTRQQLADERSRAAVDEFVGGGRIIEGEMV